METVRTETDPWRDWVRRRDRRSAVKFVSAAVLLLIVGAHVWLFRQIVDRRREVSALIDVAEPAIDGGADQSDPLGTLHAMSIAVILAASASAALMVFAGVRECRLTRRVARSDGGICPICARPTSVDDAGMSPSSQSLWLRCDHCALARPADDLRRYWEQMVASPAWASRWRRSLMRQGATTSADRFAMLLERHPVIASALFAALMASIVVAVSRFTGSTWIAALVNAIPFSVLGAATMFISIFGARRQMGDEIRRCTDCGYAQPDTGTASPTCPECGADWSRVGGTTVGRADPRAGARTLVATVGALLAVLIIAHPTIERWSRQFWPAPLLIASLGASHLRDGEIVDLLEARTLDAPVRARLLERLVEMRSEGDHLGDPVIALLDQAFVDGELDDLHDDASGSTLRDRFTADSLVVRTVGPTEAEVDEQVTVRLEGEMRGRPHGLVEVRFAFGGWRIGDAAPVGRSERLAPAMRLWPKGARSRDEGPPEVRFIPRGAGDVTIRADVWIVLDLAGTGLRRVLWDADGIPIVVDDEPLAVWRTTITHTVRAVPR